MHLVHEVPDRGIDLRHRGDVDHQVVRNVLHQLVDQPVGEGGLQAGRERAVVVAEQAHLEVRRHDEVGAVGRLGLPRLPLGEVGDEGPVGLHRGDARDPVGRDRLRDQVLRERADAADRLGQHQGRRLGAGDQGDRAAAGRGDVGVEVDHRLQVVRLGEGRAAVGAGDEDGALDGRPLLLVGQQLLHQAPQHQPAAAVGEGVDHRRVGEVAQVQAPEQVGRVGEGVHAEGGVVEADHRVVVGVGGRQQPAPLRRRSQGAEAPRGGAERAVHEQQDPRRAVGGQLPRVQRLHPLPALGVGGRHLDDAAPGVLLEIGHGLAHRDLRDELHDDGLDRPQEQLGEEAAGAALGGRLARAHVNREHRPAARRPGRLSAARPAGRRRLDVGELPGVDAVLLQQHHRVLARGQVDRELDGPAGGHGRGAAGAAAGGRGGLDGGKDLDLVEHLHVLVGHRGEDRLGLGRRGRGGRDGGGSVRRRAAAPAPGRRRGGGRSRHHEGVRRDHRHAARAHHRRHRRPPFRLRARSSSPGAPTPGNCRPALPAQMASAGPTSNA